MKQTLILLLVSLRLVAQDDYPNVDIGWRSLIDPKAPSKPEKYSVWSYSAEQMRIGSMLMSWIQKTYTPRGCLGIGHRMGNEKAGVYDSTVLAEPLRYGAIGRCYHDIRKDASGKWNPFSDTHHFIRIMANGNLGETLMLISTAEHHYFILPNMFAGEPQYEREADLFGFRNHPRLAKYPHFYSPNSNGSANGYTVVMSPDGSLPYHVITKKEYLERLRERIVREHANDLKKIAEDYRNTKDQLRKEEGDRYARRLAGYDKVYAKYKDRLHEPAEIADESGTFMLELDEGHDIFTSSSSTRKPVPVYAFNDDKVAKSGSDTPQWITVTWSAIEPQVESEVHFMKTILERFDFDYLHDYFFDREKVKDREYAPLGSNAARAQPAPTVVKPTAKEAGVFYAEDFSGVAIGQSPANWTGTRDKNGEMPKVVKLEGASGQWLRTNGHPSITPSNLNHPLPADFEISFDLAVPKDITWGTKALELLLNTSATGSDQGLLFRIRAGFSGRPGEIGLRGTLDKTHDLMLSGEATGFSNDKDPNIVKIKLVKKGGAFECFLNDQSVLAKPDAVPTGLRFQKLSFRDANNEPTDVQHYYITRLRIRPL